MLALLLSAVLSEWLQPGIISQSAGSLVVRAERSYKDAPTNTVGQLLISLFRIGTIAMGICLCLEPAGRFSFVSFAIVMGLIFSVIVLKMLCNLLLNYTFGITRRFESPYEHYGNIATLVCGILYVTMLFTIRFGTPIVHHWVLGSALVLFLALWLYRSFRMYAISLKAFGYLLLYICTLEVLPIAALYYISDKMLSLL